MHSILEEFGNEIKSIQSCRYHFVEFSKLSISLSNDECLDWSNLKAFADEKL